MEIPLRMRQIRTRQAARESHKDSNVRFHPLVALILILAALIALLSFAPRLTDATAPSAKLKPSAPNPLFFGHLAHMETATVVSMFQQRLGLSGDQASGLAVDLAGQLVSNSRIVVRKMAFFEWATYALLAAFIILSVPFIYRAVSFLIALLATN